MKQENNFLHAIAKINTFVFDIDGVLTDGSLLITEKGEELRVMNIKDGYAIVQAIRHGLHVVIISGSGNEGLRTRLERLGISDIYLNVKDKMTILSEWTVANHIKPENVLYMGDDMPDEHAMKSVGIAACPSDAVQDILEVADYVSPYAGGKGCVRDVIEKVLKLKGVW